jgi:outer membrane protein
MKKIYKITVLLALFVSCSLILNAQNKQKFGHVDSNVLLDLMPGKDSAQVKLQEYAKTLQDQFDAMQKELNVKYQDFQTNQLTMTDLIKQTKTEELQNMQTRLQTFQSSAQKDLQDKEQELLSPIIDKAKKAIQDVAKENKYTYIFDTGTGTILYSEPSDDILPLVKKYLNIE